MKKDTSETIVVFRVFKDQGDVIALFPYEINNPWDYSCDSYQTIGQHSGSDYSYVIQATRRASIDEYTALKKELERIGYNLAVRQRASKRKMNRIINEMIQKARTERRNYWSKI